jgi:hypothetical protein
MKLDTRKISSLRVRLADTLDALNNAPRMTTMRDQVDALEEVERLVGLMPAEVEALLESCYEENGDLKPDDEESEAVRVVDGRRKHVATFHLPKIATKPTIDVLPEDPIDQNLPGAFAKQEAAKVSKWAQGAQAPGLRSLSFKPLKTWHKIRSGERAVCGARLLPGSKHLVAPPEGARACKLCVPASKPVKG